MAFFDFHYNNKNIYSCQTENEFWFCLKNLGLRIVERNFDNGRIKEFLKDKEKLKQAEFIIGERRASLKLRRKNRSLFSNRSGDELPKKSFDVLDKDDGGNVDSSLLDSNSAFEVLGESECACPNCSAKMFFAKDKNSDKNLWCCECGFGARHKGE